MCVDTIGRRHRDLWEEVYTELRDLIVFGELGPNERLVTSTLGNRFGVSNGPVRTALLQLERVGLVVSAPRRGYAVVTLSPDDVIELYTVRAALETLAVRCARADGVRSTLPILRDSLDRLERALDAEDRTAAAEYDLEFHRRLCGMSRNGRLLQAWGGLVEQVRLVIATVHRSDPSVAAKSGEHRAVLDALEDGDQGAAAEALTRHLAASQRVMEGGARRLPEAVARQKIS